MNKLFAVLTTILATGCSVFGIRSSAEPIYQVLNKHDTIEIRLYPPLLIAETQVNADYKDSSSQGFQRLAGYIFGNNKTQQKLAMTAPVLQQSETLAMTAPVIQQKTTSVWHMAFVLPAGYTLASAPIPIEPAIILKEVPAKKLAVIQYSGSLSEQGIAEKSSELKMALDKLGYKATSASRSAAYDPPWTLPFLRRNEIHIDVE